ncbi:hypothetical protein JAAARDRAFT_129124 [Jaapia argillacea MUCL 33604]|uniref:CHCH domain-containing protein n=1 Tax=Jaapia argillacea MUCL 33604 TaxID=933084 RepID=A0A067PVF6_9AGAM|nr:hypothetical protein JAAARDRAFT_129124 [Jaapia argillacea MUCL 33604]
MLAQMAATAGSVAVGSTIGHGISSMLFGGSSARASEEPSPQALNQQAVAQQPAQQGGLSCEFQAKEFTKCLETNDISACNWYLEQLKAVRVARSPVASRHS